MSQYPIVVLRSERRKKQKSKRFDCGGVFVRSAQTKRERRLEKHANSFVHTHNIKKNKRVYSDLTWFTKRVSDV